MPQYGKLKIDQFLYNDSGTDVTLDLANLASKGANTFTGHQSHGDNIEARFGTDNDLLILHNNSSGFIWNTTGDTLLRGSGNGWITIQPKSGEAGIVVKPDNATELYYDGSSTPKLETTSSGVKINGEWSEIAGGTTSGRLQISGAGSSFTAASIFLQSNVTNSYRGLGTYYYDPAADVEWYTGRPYASTDQWVVCRKASQTAGGGNTAHGDNIQIRVTSAGDLQLTNNLYIVDSKKASFGNHEDLQIYHDGSHNYLDVTSGGTGNLYMSANGSKSIYIRSGNGSSGVNQAVTCLNSGAVELYWDGSKKFETDPNGVKFIDDTYVLDGNRSYWGNGNDLQIYHDGSNSYLINTTGDLQINSQGDDLLLQAADDIYLMPQGNDAGVTIKGNGASELYWDGSKKFETTTGGVNVVGALTINGAALAGGGGYASTQVFTSSGTWTKPSGIKLVRVVVTGGGGAGKGNYANNSAGGGGGGTAIKTIDVTSISSVTVTIGAGGASSQDGGVAAPSGSASSFGSHCSGGGGGGGNNWTAGGAGGSGSSGDVNIKGTMGHGYWQGLNQVNGGGGGTIWGSPVNHANAVTNYNGDIYGVGGSGGSRGSGNYWPGGAGYQGIVIVYEYK